MIANFEHRFYRTCKQLVKFCCVGILATGIHASVGFGLVHYLDFPGLLANSIGFMCAWWLSFFGHYFFTYKAIADRSKALFRFILHSVVVFSLGSLIVALIQVWLPSMPENLVPVIGAGAIAMISFVTTKFFVFRS